ncbi:dynein axonemal light chain 4 isoform X1 [Culicoides brevitarsis]|uniref:dynein axonemal light chain 4 isoform X1 n=1 Tax=Culicoides brevitarsis TaxID=469753 RepID=UPI00307B44DA
MEDAPKTEGEGDKKIIHVYPLVKHSDMNEEMRAEAIEISITACEKYAPNYEVAAKTIKETMDKKFGSYWHVVVGEGFGFEVSYETKHILYLFFGGNLAIVVWKCS